MSAMQVSVVATVYNERASIQRLLTSLAEQTRRPDEIVICDGGSRDGTAELVLEFVRVQAEGLPPVRVLVEPGANISRGRNVAIAAAHGPIIAVTDAGVRLAPGWLANLVAPWESLQAEGVIGVAGFFVPEAQGTFQSAMAATVLPLEADIVPERFLPSSRTVAFTRAAWAASGGYPEWLDYCEDLIFDMRINALAPDRPSGFVWAPRARVYFQPRDNLAAFWRQYYRYGRGDGKADLWRKRHFIRYFTYFVAAPLLLGHAFWGVGARWLGWLGLAAGLFFYCRRPWQRLGKIGAGLSAPQKAQAALWVPLIRAVGDCAKMAGYPVGRWWRWRHRGCEEIDWRKQLGAGRGDVD